MEHVNRIALVTGGNKGIGLEIACQLAEAGVSVIVGARDSERGMTAAAELSTKAYPVAFVQIDLVDEASITAAAATIAAKYGRLDALVNNAGTSIELTAFQAVRRCKPSVE